MMTRWAIQLALWLLKRYASDAVYLLVPKDALLARAQFLTTAQERIDGRSGEAKNHQVRAALMKEFPDAAQRQISRAIEAAIGD